ncbi:MAG: hypothetical protein O7H41_02515 [Planctomycetota bacterium]|nr:hypothetical protein [Planctomycetota bacterium]
MAVTPSEKWMQMAIGAKWPVGRKDLSRSVPDAGTPQAFEAPIILTPLLAGVVRSTPE